MYKEGTNMEEKEEAKENINNEVDIDAITRAQEASS